MNTLPVASIAPAASFRSLAARHRRSVPGRGAVFLAVCVSLAAFSAPVLAQDATMKQCGERWQAAKSAGTSAGTTWPKFLAECRAGKPTEAKATNAAAAKPAEPAEAAETKSGAERAATAPKPKTAAPQPKGKIVFPASVAAKHASLRPSQARQKTCGEQFRANKADGANGGLRWLEKGGGYWSLCNAKLKS